jgi:hypothetical protein
MMRQMDLGLSEDEYYICAMAIIKCHLLNKYVKAGLDVRLTPKNFRFHDMTDDEENKLVEKIYYNSELKWLQNQPKIIE